MKTTRDEILNTALHLFARRGFDAVSTSMIAGELGLTKGALYRHFENKQAIFAGIWEKMVALDVQWAEENQVPAEEFSKSPDSYRKISLSDLCNYVNQQFLFWTCDPFAADFRRMVTLEQFKSDASQKLYQDVLCAGPVRYTEDILRQMITEGALNADAAEQGPAFLALQLFAPLQLALQLYDGGWDAANLRLQLQKATKEFESRWGA